jgi:predicted SAM-dependent methyltransferase
MITALLMFLAHRVTRPVRLHRVRGRSPLKINYGCGQSAQPGYVNVDLRWTRAVDVLGDLEWCARNLTGRCDEVYVSHVLEHYRSPGKAGRNGPETVLGAMRAIHRMLKPGGLIRVAVPDFGALAKIHAEGCMPLYPRLLGRICGEQDYPQNRHLCAFDRAFLEWSLGQTGFGDFAEWDPRSMDFVHDASFDELEGRRTSLNLIARKLASA